MQDEFGNWVSGDSRKELYSRCREETNGRGDALDTAGGKHIVFKALVQLPRGRNGVAEGTTVTVSDDKDCESIRIRGEVLKSDKGQLHTRLWL